MTTKRGKVINIEGIALPEGSRAVVNAKSTFGYQRQIATTKMQQAKQQKQKAYLQ